MGQGEVTVLGLADLGVAVTAPGLGDAVQAAKAGLFEVADFVVVNQADRSGAEAMAAAFRAFRSGPVLLTSAVEGTGDGRNSSRPWRRTLRPALRSIVRALPMRFHPARRKRVPRSVCTMWGLRFGTPERPPSSGARCWGFGKRAAIRWRSSASWPSSWRRSGRLPRPAGGLLELLEPLAPDSPVARFLSRRGEGLHHVCFEVEDIHRTLAALESRGVRLVDGSRAAAPEAIWSPSSPGECGGCAAGTETGRSVTSRVVRSFPVFGGSAPGLRAGPG